jgi:hypothetical protein
MTDLILPRRKVLTGLFGFVAAPAVVKASSLMPVKSFVEPELYTFPNRVWVPKSSAVTLSQLREILKPGLQKMFDDMYEDHSEQWDNVFRSAWHDRQI